jgi:hypothetical protein
MIPPFATHSLSLILETTCSALQAEHQVLQAHHHMLVRVEVGKGAGVEGEVM